MPSRSRPASQIRLARFAIAASLSLGIPGCGGSAPAGEVTGTPDAGGATGPTKPGADSGPPVTADAGGPTPDSGTPTGADSGAIPPDPTDGTPTRKACTSAFGSAITTAHGRLDGYLVAIVQPHTIQACNSDSHVHLQISANGAVYDVATNLQTYFYEEDLPLPYGGWSEGWKAGEPLDYPNLGIHSTQFTQPANEAALAATVTKALENANHISVFAMGYGPGGVHDVHRKGSREDGAIIIDPLSPTAHGLFFCFNTDTF